jgi:hypothetical protein
MRTQLRLVERAPLAAGPQDKEDGIGTGTIRHARSSPTKAMGIDVGWEQRLEHGPELIGNSKVRRGVVIGRSQSLSWLVVLFAHTPV